MPQGPKSPQAAENGGVAGRGAGVLIRAENGDVVTFDETGLTLRLSDTVIADLQRRLAAPSQGHDMLGDIDAWHIRQDGDWLRFTAQLDPQLPPREYLCPAAGGDIAAAAPGPLYGLISIGGPRRAGFNDDAPAFPYHVLAPADHIGAVGFEGTAQADPVSGLQRLPTSTRDSLIADALLGWRRAANRGLPLFMARSETDASADIDALAQGQAYANFVTALDNLVAAAQGLGKSAKVLAVGLDFSLEDQHSDAAAYAEGMRALMRQIERDMGRRGLQRPIFLATFETGTGRIPQHPSILGQWDLAWAHGPHDFAFSAPGYMFAQDGFGRPTPEARIRMAEMDAHAIVALSARAPWSCPLFLLAENDGADIRVTAQALADLVIDKANPFAAGPAAGFAVSGTSDPVNIVSVALAKDDTKSLVLTCDRVPEGPAPMLHYAFGAGKNTGKNADNRGKIRDAWAMPSRAGGDALYRWALPAILPIRHGGK